MCARRIERYVYVNGQQCVLWPQTQVQDLLNPQELDAVRAGSHEVLRVGSREPYRVKLDHEVDKEGAVFIFRAVPVSDSEVSGTEMFLDAGSETTTSQLAGYFTARGYRVHYPGIDADARELLRRDQRFHCYRIAVLHIDVLREMHESVPPNLPLLALYPKGETAIAAMKLGARSAFRLATDEKKLTPLFETAFAEAKGAATLPSPLWDRASWIRENQEKRRSTQVSPLDSRSPEAESIESSGIKGLDLVLGGGVMRFARTTRNSRLAASVLIQGRPGTGKTVLALQMARGLLRSGKCGRAAIYACVEPLPREIRRTALAFNWRFLDDHVLFRQTTSQKEDAGIWPKLPRDKERILLIGNIDITPTWIGESWGERQDSGLLNDICRQLNRWIAEIREKHVEPGVLIIDALSPGYRLGADLPRVLFDELVRLATDSGVVLILLYECPGNEAAHLPFVTDTVITLERMSKPSPGRSTRSLEVEKSRYTDTWPGSHDMTITAGQGISVYPNLAGWARRSRPPASPNGAVETCSIGIKEIDDIPVFAYGRTSIVYSANNDLLHGLAGKFMNSAENPEPVIEIIVGNSRVIETRAESKIRALIRTGFGRPGLPPTQALFETINLITDEIRNSQRVRAAILGVHLLDHMEPTAEYVQALQELTAELERLGSAVMITCLSEAKGSAIQEVWMRTELHIDIKDPTQAILILERPKETVKLSRRHLP